MSANGNVAPVIIKRKKVVGGDGHHGGAWKVAYADFVTAMMAFFLLMWLLNATTEKQRKGIADYFSPTIPVNRISGGGSGMFGGNSVFSEETLPQNGTGASNRNPTSSDQARGDTGTSDKDAGAQMELAKIEDVLYGRGGESMVAENELRHVILKSTDEGLVVELFELPDSRLFGENGSPTQVLIALGRAIREVSRTVSNPIAVEGHVPTQPVVVAQKNDWELSVERGQMMRRLLEELGIDAARFGRVTGHADRELVNDNPMSLRNSRLEIIFLRDDGV
ncbi:flagellar motor protein MotB [Primorskyibacter aestuariivivens]|uniref:OmpA/MotB family protein n=1 Tax=Primorskyibacter aestuariivivens TaxID=1888912 RepID=UPI0023005D16|nr:flagellar motor protein MotB [Primorskyibacter aestuariivivens]MDA7427665.1 flagellar motor protein MotB [Primorskyibacter aestuariivivens]